MTKSLPKVGTTISFYNLKKKKTVKKAIESIISKKTSKGFVKIAKACDGKTKLSVFVSKKTPVSHGRKKTKCRKSKSKCRRSKH